MARFRTRAAEQGPAIPQRVHLVGAGGMHMSAIGQVLLARGHVVSGSDLVDTDFTQRLRERGATVHVGHAAANLGEAELVVTTVAAKDDNPEIAAARERGVPVIVRADMVRRLIAGRDLLAVAGSHGKTTTTAMLASMCLAGGLDPLVLLGGDAVEIGGNAREGAGPAIVEADEYAEAFLRYEPQVALITNIEADHLDYYGTEERLVAAFRAFAQRVPAEGTLIVCSDSPYADAIARERVAAGARVERYGIERADPEPGWRALNLRRNDRGGFDCTIRWDGAELGRLSLRVPGRHNVANALGALAVAMRAGVDFNSAARAVEAFNGARRRFEVVGEAAGVTVMDDYAHHPTEVRATVGAARLRFPGRRLVVVFQPHTYSRSQYLLEEWRHCFTGVDALFIAGTYAAREPASAGLDAEGLAREITSPPARYLATTEEALDVLAATLEPGDVCFTMGAGDIDALGPLLVTRLEGEAS